VHLFYKLAAARRHVISYIDKRNGNDFEKKKERNWVLVQQSAERDCLTIGRIDPLILLHAAGPAGHFTSFISRKQTPQTHL